MDEIGFLAQYNGVVVHDFWSPYFKATGADHSMCCAHILRELTGIFENHPEQKWALDMYYELLSMCRAADFYNQNPEINSRKFYMDCLKQNYDTILEEAIRQNPIPEQNGKRGRKKKGKIRALIERLQTHKGEVCRFVDDPLVPFIYSMLTHYPVYDYPCRMAEYMGKLRLYSKYTFSRHALLENDGIIDYLKSQIGDDVVITFKTFEKLFDTEYHYGAIEGLNCLEGKNISVVGLPNVDELVYKLYGMAAGVNVDQYNMRSMRLEYNGYNFHINSFDNEKLRSIQLWMLESLLEQAVGRARLLRFNSTVKVFTRFPIDQAI